jgi:hypothetical protein
MLKKQLIACLFAFLFVPVFAQEPVSKSYCTTKQIEVTDTMILLHLNEQIFEIDSLLADQGGLYYNHDSLRCINCRRPLNPKNTCECTGK